MAEALAARLMARLTEIQRDFRIPSSPSPAVGSPPGPIRNSRAKDRTPPSTGRGSSSGGADERFVPADHPDRNAKQALDLLEAPLALNPDRVHEMPASDGGLELDQAAEAYAREATTSSSTSACSAWDQTAMSRRSFLSTPPHTQRAP